MDTSAAPVLEVFASYQGEGLFVGEPQTFLRLAGCPLRCRYCDTPHSWAVPPEGDEQGWLTPFGAILRVAEVELDTQRSLSVTGGEPLAWPSFLIGLVAVAGDRPLHLETAGHDLEALATVLSGYRHLSLDLKLPADLAPPSARDFAASGRSLAPLPAAAADWDALRPRQLELAREHVAAGNSACVKLVVRPGADIDDYRPLLDDLERLAPDLPLFIAPESPRGVAPDLHGTPALDLDPVDALVERCLERSLAPRILPQLHRALGVR